MLTPIDEAYALRPSLAHMSSTRNEADAKAKAAAEDEEDEKPSEPQHIRVRCLLLRSWAGGLQGKCRSKARVPPCISQILHHWTWCPTLPSASPAWTK